MSNTREFRQELQQVVTAFDQSRHPLIDKWAAGEVKHETIAGAISEIWHWISHLIPEALFNIASKAPADVIDMEMENYQDELDPANPHPELILRFAEACGVKRAELIAGRGLPTTEAWRDWELEVTRQQPWIAGCAAVHISSEAQEPRLINRILPALRETYHFSEHDLEFWWLHSGADIEHGGRAFDILARHCDTREKQEMALHWAREGARRKYFFWDGINLQYEIGYPLRGPAAG